MAAIMHHKPSWTHLSRLADRNSRAAIHRDLWSQRRDRGGVVSELPCQSRAQLDAPPGPTSDTRAKKGARRRRGSWQDLSGYDDCDRQSAAYPAGHCRSRKCLSAHLSYATIAVRRRCLSRHCGVPGSLVGKRHPFCCGKLRALLWKDVAGKTPELS